MFDPLQTFGLEWHFESEYFSRTFISPGSLSRVLIFARLSGLYNWVQTARLRAGGADMPRARRR